MAFSPDELQVASGGDDKTIRLFSLVTGVVETLAPNPDYINSIAFCPRGQFIASAGFDKRIQLYDLLNNSVQVLTGHSKCIYSITFSSDG